MAAIQVGNMVLANTESIQRATRNFNHFSNREYHLIEIDQGDILQLKAQRLIALLPGQINTPLNVVWFSVHTLFETLRTNPQAGAALVNIDNGKAEAIRVFRKTTEGRMGEVNALVQAHIRENR
jgi:hypothetical protein